VVSKLRCCGPSIIAANVVTGDKTHVEAKAGLTPMFR